MKTHFLLLMSFHFLLTRKNLVAQYFCWHLANTKMPFYRALKTGSRTCISELPYFYQFRVKNGFEVGHPKFVYELAKKPELIVTTGNLPVNVPPDYLSK